MTSPDQIGAMKKVNLPLTSRAHGTSVEVTTRRRFAYRTLADCFPTQF